MAFRLRSSRARAWAGGSRAGQCPRTPPQARRGHVQVSRTHRASAFIVTAAIFCLLFRRIPPPGCSRARSAPTTSLFFAAMIPEHTLLFLLGHAGADGGRALVSCAGSLLRALAGAGSVLRGRLLQHQRRPRNARPAPVETPRSPFLQLGSTVLFLVLSEYLHLVAWATIGILQIRSEVARELLWGPPLVAAVWLAVFTYSRLAAPTSPGMIPHGTGTGRTDPADRSRAAGLGVDADVPPRPGPPIRVR